MEQQVQEKNMDDQTQEKQEQQSKSGEFMLMITSRTNKKTNRPINAQRSAHTLFSL